MFHKTLNVPVIFITNSSEKDRGSSLYIIHQNGTIRCSGSNEGGRNATTFIRPYLIGYITPKKKNVLFQEASLGLSPFEGNAKDYSELNTLQKTGYGHGGNVITEIISYENLMNPFFVPRSWQGPENQGIDWSIARREILQACVYVVTNNFSFLKEERTVILDKNSHNRT